MASNLFEGRNLMARGAKRVSKLGVVRGERYALVPEEVMESVSYHAQPDWARSVLFAVAARCNGHNNGDISLTFSEAKRLGIAAQWKLYAGLRLLERADLIVCTRRGRLERGTKLASLYAVTWRGISKCEGIYFDAGIAPCPIPTHAWVKWTKPSDWTAFVKQTARSNKGRKNPHTTHGGVGRSYHGGATHAEIAPTVVEKEIDFVAPTVVDASKTSGLGSQTSDESLAPTPLPRTSGRSRRLDMRNASAHKLLVATPETDGRR